MKNTGTLFKHFIYLYLRQLMERVGVEIHRIICAFSPDSQIKLA